MDNIAEFRIGFKARFGHSPKTGNNLFKKLKQPAKATKDATSAVHRKSPRQMASTQEVDYKTSPVKKKKVASSEKVALVESKRPGKFLCTDCGKGFAFNNSLKKHKETKHSRQTFQCDICDKIFVYKDSVLRHKNIFHSSDPIKFGCTICTQTFRYKCNLKVHVKCHNM